MVGVLGLCVCQVLTIVNGYKQQVLQVPDSKLSLNSTLLQLSNPLYQTECLLLSNTFCFVFSPELLGCPLGGIRSRQLYSPWGMYTP